MKHDPYMPHVSFLQGLTHCLGTQSLGMPLQDGPKWGPAGCLPEILRRDIMDIPVLPYASLHSTFFFPDHRDRSLIVIHFFFLIYRLVFPSKSISSASESICSQR